MPDCLPDNARRLFAHYGKIDDLAASAPGMVMARLMEEGDSDDLRWLIDTYSEKQITEWFVQHGHRQLSRRSRSFWQLLLNRPDPTTPGTTDELWPL